MKVACRMLLITVSALLTLIFSSSALEDDVFTSVGQQRRRRLDVHRKITDDVQLPSNAEGQTVEMVSISSTSSTMESSDMPTEYPTYFPSYTPTYSSSTSSTSIEITPKTNPQPAPTKVTSLKSPPSAAKKTTPPTKVTRFDVTPSTMTKSSKYINSTSAKSSKSTSKSSKSTSKSSKSVSDETCPTGCSYVCEPVTSGKSSKSSTVASSKSSKASSNGTSLDFTTVYSSTYEEMSSIEGSCLCGYCMDCSSLPLFEQAYCNDSCMFVKGAPKPSVVKCVHINQVFLV